MLFFKKLVVGLSSEKSIMLFGTEGGNFYYSRVYVSLAVVLLGNNRFFTLYINIAFWIFPSVLKGFPT